jgi:SlyX protein
MNSDAVERLETKIAFLESANLELSDVLYRQQQEIRELRERLDALTQQVLAGQTPQVERSLEDERPPHY